MKIVGNPHSCWEYSCQLGVECVGLPVKGGVGGVHGLTLGLGLVA